VCEGGVSEQDCIFCKIGRGEIPSPKLFDDGQAFAISDINPKAPTHLLVIPYSHVEALAAASAEQLAAAAHCMAVAPRIAADAGLADDGYGLVVNQGSHSGQEVPHLHMHILGGKPLAGMG
jgi:histidine triad (HIT) family protein